MMNRPGTASAKRSSTLRAMAWSTALAGSMALVPGIARAQNNTPGGQVVVTPVGGGAPTFNGGSATLSGNNTNLDVELRAPSTIINWARFNIASGSRVDFGTAQAGQVAVLNRVTGTGMSNIRGALTSDANVNVFLVNPNGIMVGSGGSVSTGSFVASTRDISNTDFTNGNYQFSGSSDGDVVVNGGITTKGSGIGLILLGRRVTTYAALNSGAQDTALVAADDVTLNFTPGSPLGIQITRGTDVGQAMQVVGGSIQGRNVYFAMATRLTATNSLLQIDGDVKAIGGEKGIVIVGGQSAIDPDVRATGLFTGNQVAVTTSGKLTYEGTGAAAGVHIGGTDLVTVAGGVSSQGDYKVRGPGVTLGETGTVVRQEAAGGVLVTSSTGDITGVGSLSLAADTGGLGGRALVLDAGEDINFGNATTLTAGGTGLASALNIFTGSRNADIKLGNVNALTLDGGLSGGALEGKLSRAAFLGNGGDITLGLVNLGGAATLESDDLTLGSLSGVGAVSLQAGAAMRAGTVASTGGAVTLVANGLSGTTSAPRANVSAAGAVSITATGNALLGTVQSAGGAVTLDAGSFDASSITAATGATLTTRTGTARLGGLAVSAGSASLVAADDATVTGAVSVSGDYAVTGEAVTLGGNQAAGGAATITARSGAVSNSGTLALTSNSDGVGTEALTLAGRMALTGTSTLNGGTANQSAVVIDTAAANDVSLRNVNAASLAIAGGATLGGDLVLGNVVTTGDLSFQSNQSIGTGNLSSTAGLVRLQAPTINTGNLTAATDVALSGRQVDFGAINAATATLATTGTNGTRRLSGTSVTTTGAAALNSDSGAIAVGTITAGGLNVTAVGPVSFNTVSVSGAATIATSAAASDVQLGTLSATGDVSLTSGRNIVANAVTSSAGALSLTAAGNISGTGGGRAALSSAAALTLAASGNARLATISGNSVNLSAATIDSGTISGPAGITVTTTGGDLALTGLTTTAGDVRVVARGAASVTGPVTVVGNYAVTGAGVTLGGSQEATGAIDVTATAGNTISSNPGLRLTANADGVGTEALTLHGGANLGTDTLLRGGPNRESQVIIDSSAAGNFRLGDVDAGGLVIAGGAPLSGSLTFGNVTTTGPVTLVVDGGITGTGIVSTAGAVSLSGAGAASVGNLSGSTVDVAMRGDVTVTRVDALAGNASLASSAGGITLSTGTATGDVRVDGFGAVSIADAVTAGADYRVRGATVSLGSDPNAEVQTAGGSVDIMAATGAITGGPGLTLRSGTGNLILDGAGGIAFGAGVLQAGTSGTGQLGLRAGSGQAISLGDSVKLGTLGSVDAGHTAIAAALSHDGNLSFGTLDAANAVDIRLAGATLSGNALNGGGTVAMDVGTGTVNLAALSGTSLTVNGGTLQGGAWRASGDAALDGGTISLTSLDSGGAATATTRAGTLSIDTAHAATDLSLTAAGPGDVSVGLATAGRNLSLIARQGSILVDSAAAGATLTLDSAGDIRGRTGAAPDLSGKDVVLRVTGNLTTGSIQSPGGLDITAASMNIGRVDAGQALSLTARQGGLVLNSATAGGAINFTAATGIDVGTLTGGAGMALDAGGNLSVRQLSAGGAVTARSGGVLSLSDVRAAGLTTNAATSTLGKLVLDSLSVQGGSARIDDATVTGTTSTDLTGALDIGVLRSGGLTLKAGSIAATSLTAGAAADLTSTNGAIAVGQLNGSGAITLTSAGAANVTGWQTAGDLTITAVGDAVLGTGTSAGFTVAGNNISVTDATANGDAKLTAAGALNISALRSGNLSLKAGSIAADSLDARGTADITSTTGGMDLGTLNGMGAISLGSAAGISVDQWQAPAGLTVTAVGDVALGTGTASALTVAGSGVTVTDATVSGDAKLTATNVLNIGALRGRNLAFKAGTITANGLTAGGTADLTSTTGAINIGQLAGTGAITIGSAAGVSVTGWQAPAGLAVTAVGDVALGTGTASALTVAGSGVTITDATVSGDAKLTATNALNIGALRGRNLAFKAGTITANGLTAGGTADLTSTAGAINIGQLAGIGAVTMGSAAGVSVTGWQTPAGLAVTAVGDVALGTGTASALTVAGSGIAITDATVTGDTTLTAANALSIRGLRGGGLAFKAGSIAADSLTATGAANLASTAGSTTLKQLNAAGAVTLTAADAVAVDQWQAPAGMTVTAVNAVTLGTGSASALTVTGGSITLADGTVGGDVALTAKNALGVTRLRAANAVLKGGAVTLGTLNLGALTVTGASATIADATVTGATSADVTGALGVDKLTSASATLLAGGAATLGTVTATNAATIRAGDLTLAGALKAPAVTVGSHDGTAGLRLGSTADASGTGAGLSEGEIGKINADRLVLDGGSGPVAIGTLAFGTDSGRSRVDVLTTGDMTVTGVVKGSGAGRLFRFGGSSNDTDLARSIQIVATPDAGGRLLLDNADVELRGARIALGQSGLLNGLFANGGASSDQAAALISNSNSPLYSALAGGSPYLPGQETTLSAARMTVRFGTFALFQNTGTRGFNTGVVLSGSPSGGATLSAVGPGNGIRAPFALFGTINGVSGTSTSVLGNTVINSSGLDLANSRVNGCVLGTAAGCLTTTISQPTLNVFDPGRLVVFRAEADFTLPFDPVIGSNNEALFAGVGSIAEPLAPDEEEPASEAQPDQQPQPSQEQK